MTEGTLHQRQASWFGGLEATFRHFGGVTKGSAGEAACGPQVLGTDDRHPAEEDAISRRPAAATTPVTCLWARPRF